jgi:hypothetical protein
MFVHIDNAELQTTWFWLQKGRKLMCTLTSDIAGLFNVLMNLYLHRWIIGKDSSRYKFSMIEIKDQTLVALK